MVLRTTGVLFIGLGLLLMRALDGATVNTVGLGLWCVGVLLLLDALLGRDGLPAQLLWGVGVAFTVVLLSLPDLPNLVATGPGSVVVAVATVLLGVAVFLRPPR